MNKHQKKLAAGYPVEFPEDLFAFHEFAHGNGKLLAAMGVHTDGPFSLLSGKPLDGDGPRFYRDPPELFTVMLGNMDGLHWGYWFDAPNELPPVVASYFHSDAFQLTVNATLFEAMRDEIEGHWVTDEDYKADEPDEPEYDRRLERLAKLREQLSKFALKERKEIGEAYQKKYVFTTKKKLARKPIAKTRNNMGIVAKPSQYRSLPGVDRFLTQHDYEPMAKDVEKMVDVATQAAADGKSATALKLGHDLWPYSEHAQSAYAMLRLGYAGLERPVLAKVLDQAIEFRKRCDERR